MSRDGPPASSFTEPRITGFLTKQGGQGFAANWRKRYFVLDNHYLFYYKSKQDRKPVGVVCLSDYKCCKRAPSKECKKSKYTFIIEKGDHVDQQDLGYAIRNYYIFAENEADMTSWIEAITNEISSLDDFSRRGPKVDTKAFDELTTTVESGTKLSHPTAARPKPQGRRPPRKYIPFNEDEESASPRVNKRPMSVDSLEGHHSPGSTTPVRTGSTEETTSGGSGSPPQGESTKRGHHPSIAMMPKQKEQTTNNNQPPLEDHTLQEQEATPPVAKPTAILPTPPPASAKPKQQSSMPSLNEEEEAEPVADKQLENSNEIKPQNRPPPPSTKPAPPPTKPKNKRSATDVSSITPSTLNKDERNEDQNPVDLQPPLTTADTVLPTPQSSSMMEKKFSKPNPPRKIKKGISSEQSVDVVEKPIPKPRTKSTVGKDDSKRSSTTDESSANTSRAQSQESLVNETTPTPVTVPTDQNETETSIEELNAGLSEMKQFIQEVRETPTVVNVATSAQENPTVKKIGYENVTVNVKQDGQLTLTAPESITEDMVKKQTEQSQPTSATPPPNKDQVDMIIASSPNSNQSDSIYDIPRSTPVPEGSSDDVVYDIPSPRRVNNKKEEVDYDIPNIGDSKPNIPTINDTPTDKRPLSIENDYDEPLTFSMTSDKLTPFDKVTPSDRVKSIHMNGQNSSLSPLDDSFSKEHLSPERDAWGYALVNKKRSQPSIGEPNTSVTATDTLASHVQMPEDIASIPANLQKAKEVLRLAMIVKAEVLEMRQEVEKELAIARRERHDSQLMKQNAAEILKMAKDVLQRVQTSS